MAKKCIAVCGYKLDHLAMNLTTAVSGEAEIVNAVSA